MSILSTSSKLVRVGDSYSAGEGISIENNVISVTGDYGHAYYPGDNISISDDNVISSKDWSSDIDTAAQNVSAETTAWVSEQGYITDASLSDYALITDVETTSGLLKMDIDTVSGSISGKMDTTAFNDWQNGQYSNDIAGLSNDIGTVSGAVDAISGAVSSLDIPTRQDIENASGYAYSQSTAWSDSQGYLKEHQDISYLATKDEVSAYTLTTTLEQVSGDIVSQIPSIEGLATKSEVDTVSSFLSGAIDYVSANAGDEFPASANDAITAYQTYSGTYLTAHQSLDGYLTKSSADTLYQPIGNYALENDLEQVSGDLKDDIDYISGVAITAHQDLSNYATTGDLNTASSFLSGAIDYVSGQIPVIPDISANEWNSVYDTVESNSASWTGGGGGSIDTIPVAVISPLVTGFSGESAYLGIESTALNLSSYVPVSAIGVNSQGYVSGISGKNISAYYSRTSLTSNYSYTADRAYHDRNNNEITSYYQPKLTITGDAGTITSINGSAVGASIPEGWELVAGAGIEIVDDAENNQTTISVTAAGGNPEVESYVQTNSASIDDVVSTYQTNSGSYITQETDWTNTITAASSYAYSEAVAQIPAPFDPTYMSGAIDQNASDIQYISGVAITALPSDLATTGDVNDLAQSISETYQVKGDYLVRSESANFYPMTGNPSGFLTTHQDISNKLDTTAFSDVSGSFLTAVNIPESANWNDATTAYQTNSATYLTAHQAISANEWNSNYETVTTNSGVWNDVSVYQTNSATYMTEPNLEYNAVNEISGYNGSAIAQYGAEKQWLVHDDTLVHAANSAQYALGVNLSAVAQLLGVDETVLFSSTATVKSAILSEPITAFKKMGVMLIDDHQCQRYVIADTNYPYVKWFSNYGFDSWNTGSTAATLRLVGWSANNDKITCITGWQKNCNYTASNATWNVGQSGVYGNIKYVIGIGRKQ